MTEGDTQTTDPDFLRLRAERGSLFLTLSLLAEHDDLDREFGDRWATNQRRAMRLAYHEGATLARAIEPLFEDIADRRRHPFVDDFLLDTPSKANSRNINEIISLEMPRTVSWGTAMSDTEIDLGDVVTLETRCRTFWFVHSNGSLTYHLSFELEYEHDARHYYALSLLQKLIFEREQTEWVRAVPLVRREDGTPQKFWDFVAHKLEAHARELFVRLGLLTNAEASRHKDLHFWHRLWLGRRTRERDALAKVAREALPDPYPERRTIVLLRDPYFFRLLDAKARSGVERYSGEHAVADGLQRLNIGLLSNIDPIRLDYCFLSGWFQNSTDFLRQGTADVQEGVSPLFPPQDHRGPDRHAIVYANANSIFEVVAKSRSLDAGQGHIGTCPNLFLVHVMIFHNEALVQVFEREITRLVDGMQLNSLAPASFLTLRDEQAARIVERFLAYRLTMFHEIETHVYFNAMRYDAERGIYGAVEKVRGIGPRKAYWADVLTRLGDTVGDIRAKQRQEGEDRIARLLAILTVFSIFQVLFQATDVVRKFIGRSIESKPWIGFARNSFVPDYIDSAFLLLLSVMLMFLLLYAWRRTVGRPGRRLDRVVSRWSASADRFVRSQQRRPD